MADIERSCDEKIAWIIEHFRPDQYDDAIREEDAWPFFYHLSSLRTGLLAWYPFARHWRVLEVCGGFGALTGCLAERVAAVDVVEGDPLRAASIRKRYEGYARVTVTERDFLASFEGDKAGPDSPASSEGSKAGPDSPVSSEGDMAGCYDCVVLIDGLDVYAGRREELLSRCAAVLKPGGILLCGYRNRLGLPYLCGGVDDFQKEPFENLSAQSSFLLRGEADRLFEDAGFAVARYYYPLPGPYFTQAVYTDAAEKLDSVRDRVFALNPFSETRIADENALYDDVIHAGLLSKLAGYYLVECRNVTAEDSRAGHLQRVKTAQETKPERECGKEVQEKAWEDQEQERKQSGGTEEVLACRDKNQKEIAAGQKTEGSASEDQFVASPRGVRMAALSVDRGKAHGFATICYDDGMVEKRALWKEGKPALGLLMENLGKLAARGILTVPQKKEADAIVMPFVTEKPLLQHIREQMEKGPEAVLAVLDLLREDILQSSDPIPADEGECYRDYGLGAADIGPVLAEGMIDMIPYNAFWADGRIRYYDQEFCVPHCPVRYILFRALRYTWLHLPALEEVLPIRVAKEHFQLTDTSWAYQRREEQFVAANRNYAHFPQVYQWAGKAASLQTIERNRHALLSADPAMTQREMLQEVHGVQIGLLREFDRVCVVLGLRYFAIHGTLLGAVRHAGFIPWDDDVDLAMLREDFDRLRKEAPEILQKPYVLQTAENEDGCFYGGYAKLRDSNTTALEPQNRGKQCNQGIWIDILPLDHCPVSEKKLAALQRRITRWQRLLLAKIYRPESGIFSDVDPGRISFYYLAARCLRRRWILARLDKLFHSVQDTGRYAILACCYGEKENRNHFAAEDFEKALPMPFEELELPVPNGYDRILTARYGSAYRKVPPVSRQYRHGKVIFSAARPWWKEQK